MILTLNRHLHNSYGTIGELLIDDRFECYTLEPAEGEGKGPIPCGCYKILITWSNRFGRAMPLLQNVPGFEGIRIHPGNTDKDTAGCILVGQSAGKYDVENSRAAYDVLYSKLRKAVDCGITPVITVQEGKVNAA